MIEEQREHLTRLSGLLPESQGRNLALTVVYVPYSLFSGPGKYLRVHEEHDADHQHHPDLQGYLATKKTPTPQGPP